MRHLLPAVALASAVSLFAIVPLASDTERRGSAPMAPGMGPGMGPSMGPGMGPSMSPGMGPGMGPGMSPSMGPTMPSASAGSTDGSTLSLPPAQQFTCALGQVVPFSGPVQGLDQSGRPYFFQTDGSYGPYDGFGYPVQTTMIGQYGGLPMQRQSQGYIPSPCPVPLVPPVAGAFGGMAGAMAPSMSPMMGPQGMNPMTMGPQGMNSMGPMGPMGPMAPGPMASPASGAPTSMVRTRSDRWQAQWRPRWVGLRVQRVSVTSSGCWCGRSRPAGNRLTTRTRGETSAANTQRRSCSWGAWLCWPCRALRHSTAALGRATGSTVACSGRRSTAICRTSTTRITRSRATVTTTPTTARDCTVDSAAMAGRVKFHRRPGHLQLLSLLGFGLLSVPGGARLRDDTTVPVLPAAHTRGAGSRRLRRRRLRRRWLSGELQHHGYGGYSC